MSTHLQGVKFGIYYTSVLALCKKYLHWKELFPRSVVILITSQAWESKHNFIQNHTSATCFIPLRTILEYLENIYFFSSLILCKFCNDLNISYEITNFLIKSRIIWMLPHILEWTTIHENRQRHNIFFRFKNWSIFFSLCCFQETLLI